MWGDNSESVTVGNRTQGHIYSQPGSYTISVTTTENSETFSVQKLILVLGNIPCMKLN